MKTTKSSSTQLSSFQSLTKNHIFFLISILIIFIVFSTLYSLYAPAFEGPDEQYHYGFAKDVYSGTLSKEDYVRQGPFYYSILAFFLNFLNPPDNIEIEKNNFFPRDSNKFIHSYEEQFPYRETAYSVHVLRFFSIAFGVITLIFVYKIALLLFAQNKTFSLFTVAFVALIPKFTWMNSVINPDSLVYATSTIAIYFLFRFIKYPSKNKFLILLSVFTGLSLLTKANAGVLYVIIASTFLFLLFSKTITKKFFFSKLTLIAIISILSGTWFSFHRMMLTVDFNNLHYKSIFSLLTSTTSNSSEPVNFFEGLSHFTEFSMIHQRMFEMLWGWLGWHVIKTSSFYLIIGDVMILLALTGLFLVFIKKIKWNYVKIHSKYLVILFSGTGFMIFAMLTYFYNGGHGDIRYTFPVISLFGVLFTLGIQVFFKKRKLRHLLILPILILIFMNIHLIETMNLRYDHGFKPLTIDPFVEIQKIYEKRPDLQKFSPEAADGNFAKLIKWADSHGHREHPVLKKHEALYDLLVIYYSRSDLQNSFPEVIYDHNIKNLLNWAIDVGVYEEPKIRIHDDYFYGFYKNTI